MDLATLVARLYEDKYVMAIVAYLLAIAYLSASVWVMTKFTQSGLEDVRNHRRRADGSLITASYVAFDVGFYTLLLAMYFAWCRHWVLIDPPHIWVYWGGVMLIVMWRADHLATQQRRGFVNWLYG
jgi:hypothetical protein